jgi:hypothetical protein
MIKVESKDGKVFDFTKIDEVKLLDSSVDIVNIWWIVFWVIIFFPIAIVLAVLGMSSKKYTCVVKSDDYNGVHTFDKVNYHRLMVGL